jgi:hypothetical protein
MLLVNNTLPLVVGGPGQGGQTPVPWSPYSFAADSLPIVPNVNWPGTVCPDNIYDVYIARCDLQNLTSDRNCIKVLNAATNLPPSTPECAYVDDLNNNPLKSTFIRCDPVICFIANPINPTSFPRPIFTTTEFFALYYPIQGDGQTAVPVLNKLKWSASVEFLNNQTIMDTVGQLRWIDKDNNQGDFIPTANNPVKILLVSTNESS